MRVPWTARASNQSILKEINLNTDWKTDAEAEASILVTKSPFSGKDPDAGKDRRQEKEMTKDEMVGWHH